MLTFLPPSLPQRLPVHGTTHTVHSYATPAIGPIMCFLRRRHDGLSFFFSGARETYLKTRGSEHACVSLHQSSYVSFSALIPHLYSLPLGFRFQGFPLQLLRLPPSCCCFLLSACRVQFNNKTRCARQTPNCSFFFGRRQCALCFVGCFSVEYYAHPNCALVSRVGRVFFICFATLYVSRKKKRCFRNAC